MTTGQASDREAKERHLWEYEHRALGEVPINHKAPPCYASWQDFIESDALRCNCTYMNPLVYWFWELPYTEEEDSQYHTVAPEDVPEDEKFDRVHLIYASWFSGVTRFKVRVKKEDEAVIRVFIRGHQVKVAV